MALKTGFTSDTPTRLQLNAGVLCTSYTPASGQTPASITGIIGATRDGGTISIVPEMHQAAVDGAPTYTKGLERKDGVEAKISFNCVEFTAENIKLALGAGASESSNKLTGTRTVNSSDYTTIYWVGDTAGGTDIYVKLVNALSLGGLNMSVTDKGEGTFALELTAHYSDSDLDSDPYEIGAL